MGRTANIIRAPLGSRPVPLSLPLSTTRPDQVNRPATPRFRLGLRVQRRPLLPFNVYGMRLECDPIR